MTATEPRTRPSRSAAVVGLGSMLAANLVAGVPAYVVAFIVPYGFRDVVGPPEHLAFLTMVGVFGCATGVLGAVVDTTASPRVPARSLALVVPASLSLNALVVALGSVVSALNKDAGSVSAGFSPVSDVLVAGGLLLLSALLALAARRAWRS